MPWNACNKASAVGKAVARLGLPTYKPASFDLLSAKRWRTTLSIRLRTRSPIDSKRIRPVAR